MKLVIELDVNDLTHRIDAFVLIHELFPKVFALDDRIRTVRMHEATMNLVQTHKDLYLPPKVA